MSTNLKALWQRERARREALLELESLHPGDTQAKPHLAVLDKIDSQDRAQPIGEAYAISIDELRQLVSESQFEGVDGNHFMIVLDQYIPQPWRMRFEAASTLSSRRHEGCYAHDWHRFLRLWLHEMDHLAAHRKEVNSD